MIDDVEYLHAFDWETVAASLAGSRSERFTTGDMQGMFRLVPPTP